MGGKGSGRPTDEQIINKNITVQKQNPIAKDMFLPNLSGIARNVNAVNSYAKLDGTNHPFSYVKTPKIYPNADSTTAIQILKADGTTSVLNVDTTNSRVGILTTPIASFHVNGNELVDGGLTQRFTYMLTTPVIGLDMQSNSTASLANPVKMSPSLSFRGQAWNTTPTASSKVNAMVMYMKPVSGTTTSGKITFANNTIDGTANTTELMSILSDGKIGIGVEAPTAVKAGTTGKVIEMLAPAPAGSEIIIGTEDTIIGSADQFVGGYIFKNGDTSGTEPHYAGMWALGQETGGMNLHFSANRDGYETGGSDMVLDEVGDFYFKNSGTGLPYGSCYGSHIGWTQATAVQNTWYNISDADMADGELNLVTHDGSGKLTVAKAGRYLINYNVTFEDTIANNHVEVGLEITGSGSANAQGISHSENKFANEEEDLAGTAILSLAANDTIELCIRTTDATTPDFSVQDINLTAVMVGG